MFAFCSMHSRDTVSVFSSPPFVPFRKDKLRFPLAILAQPKDRKTKKS